MNYNLLVNQPARTLKSIGQAYSTVSSVVTTAIATKRIRPKPDYEKVTDEGQIRVYGDGDEDRERVELAKVVSVQLEKEKQKTIQEDGLAGENVNLRKQKQELKKEEGETSSNQNSGMYHHLLISFPT